ncbi:MAG: DUF4124 domain-containing protein [Gammaproteobacteria bacterium]|nr:MAG: DUF4124 domain-containing protein [Gammaproteobacteria bacterium]
MKIVLRVAVLVFVVFAAMSYFGYLQPAQIPWQKWVADLKTVTADIVPKNESSEAKNTVKVSKWTDENGVVHYENRPVDGAKTIEVDPDNNILPSAPVAKLPEAESKPKTMNEEMEELRQAKQRQMEAIINR